MIMRRSLYEHLLPTLGARTLPVLFRRLKKAAEGTDRDLLELVAGAIASIGGEEAARGAADLLGDSSPFIQRAAMSVLARQPASGCLDKLWAIHCAMMSDRARFLRPGEFETNPYQDSFDALLSCVKLDPTWLSGAVRRAEPAQPVPDLAYLLGNLNGQEALWRDCKPFLFAKVAPDQERSLAANIRRHRDADEIQWLIDRVHREDDFLGPVALRALCAIDPDRAVRELPRLPIRLLGFTSRWCFTEILRQRPEETRACVRRMLDEPGAIEVVTVYQDDPSAVDLATLDALLDHFSTILSHEFRAPAGLPSSP